MIDGHIFVDAYFTDEERKTLETVWFNPDNKEYNSHIIIAEEGDSEWEKFLKTPIDDTGRCATLEDLYERTYIRLKEIEEAHKKIIIDSVMSEDKFLSEAKQDLNKQSMTKLLEVIFTLDSREILQKKRIEKDYSFSSWQRLSGINLKTLIKILRRIFVKQKMSTKFLA